MAASSSHIAVGVLPIQGVDVRAQTPWMTSNQMLLRKGRRSVGGQLYLITFATRDRAPRFRDWEVAAHASRLLSDAENWRDSRLLAWVLMPDHWHGLVELHHGDTLAGRIGWIKSHSARQLRQAHPGMGRVWAPAYHDRALRHDEDLRAISHYLLMNPVRAGLSTSARLYPFWDAIWL
jgi:REP element-mobilizing transposase RayT